MRTIPSLKIISLFKKINSGKTKPIRRGNRSLGDPANCKIVYDVDKYTITFFNDCGLFNYIESIQYGGRSCSDQSILSKLKPSQKELKEIWNWI